ncbi:MAG TPA: hypothetical protein VIY48_11110 [Candidatus Paceibacterota bacterium]
MTERRGRPHKPEDDKVLSNGFFPRQWERLQAEATARGFSDVAPYLRQIVDDYFAVLDAERAEAEENADSDTDYENDTTNKGE